MTTIKPGTQSVTLPNGQVVSLCDYVYGPNYSALCLSPIGEGCEWHLFQYGLAQPVPELDRVNATPLHTNIARNGDWGLPQGWEGIVTGWSAVSSMEGDAFGAWIASTHAEFRYNRKTYFESPLLHLFKGPGALESFGAEGAGGELITDPAEILRLFDDDKAAGRINPMPVHMRENLSYEVILRADAHATRRLRAELRSFRDRDPGLAEALVRLQVLRSTGGRGGEGGEIDKILGLLTDPREVGMVWLRLHGLWKRVVV